MCYAEQVHIKHAGVSKMLYNSIKLKGIAPKIQKLAKREGEARCLYSLSVSASSCRVPRLDISE